MRQNVDRLSKAEAIAVHYSLGSLNCTRVEIFDSARPVFIVRGIAEFDLQEIRREMTDPSQPVFLAAMLASIAAVDQLLDLARPSGVWNAPRDIELGGRL